MEAASIADRVNAIQARIASQCEAAHRPKESVRLVAVSKTKPVSDLLEAYAAGVRVFG